MKALIRDGRLIEDRYLHVAEGEPVPPSGPILIGLGHWLAARECLMRRGAPLGVRLASDQHPEVIAGDVARFALIALEFPAFRDGRAYTYARLLRERWGYSGELRAVGDVLLEQLHLMQRVGFDCFELSSHDPLRDWQTAMSEFTTWYQATGDGREPARVLRHTRGQVRRLA